jgi:hypothetical protein
MEEETGTARAGALAAADEGVRRGARGGRAPRLIKSLGVVAGLVLTVGFALAAPAAEPGGTNQFGPVSDSDRHSAGVVIGDDGQAVAGAKIQVTGIGYDHGGQRWGPGGQLVQEPVVSDVRGRFQLMCKSNVDLIHAMVSAPGAAPRPMQFQPGRDYVIRLNEGVRVTGRLVAAGRPVAGAAVLVQPESRPMGEFYVSDQFVTYSNGDFSVPHQPADKNLVLFATMDSLQGKGALSPKSFTSGKNHTTTNLGELTLQPAFQVAGRILLADGKPVPAGSRLLLARQGVSDLTWYKLEADGRFAFPSVPAESVSLGARLTGYRFSHRNPSLDWLNNQIVGRVDHDMTNLTLELEPGEHHYTPTHDDAAEGTDLQPRDKPLRGVPAG